MQKKFSSTFAVNQNFFLPQVLLKKKKVILLNSSSLVCPRISYNMCLVMLFTKNKVLLWLKIFGTIQLIIIHTFLLAYYNTQSKLGSKASRNERVFGQFSVHCSNIKQSLPPKLHCFMDRNLILKIMLRLEEKGLGKEYCKINPQKRKWDFKIFLIKS